MPRRSSRSEGGQSGGGWRARGRHEAVGEQGVRPEADADWRCVGQVRRLMHRAGRRARGLEGAGRGVREARRVPEAADPQRALYLADPDI